MLVELEQTKGKIKLVGKVAGIDSENAKREGYTQSEKKYKSISFFLQTSPMNRVRVELFGMEREYVYAYSQKERKSKKVEWAKRHDNHGDYKVMGVSVNLEGDKDSRKVMVEMDAIDFIYENLKNDDVVRVTGQIDFQEYENQNTGEMVQSKRFNIGSITKLESLDFEAEDFKEESKFEQEIVVTDTMIDDETGKLVIGAKVIKYGGEHVNTSFVVDGEKYPKLKNNMAKRLSYGDFLKVYGLIVNMAVLEEDTEQQESFDDDDWGGDADIQNDFSNSYITSYIQELQITSVDSASYEQKKYKEEDFLSEEEDAFNGDLPSDSDFNEDEDDEFDDLPFS